MNRYVEQFEHEFELLKRNVGIKWPRPNIYVAVDMHKTAVKPTWTTEISTEFYPDALEALQLMSADPEVVLILWSGSIPEQNLQYQEYLKTLGVEVRYINCNPECANTPYGDYTKKFYMNVGLDDKCGFKAEKDWHPIKRYFQARKTARELKGILKAS